MLKTKVEYAEECIAKWLEELITDILYSIMTQIR